MRHKALIIPLLVLALGGCAGKMDAQRGLSEEWRLRSLEENFLNFKEGQRQQEEQGRDQQRKLMERMKAVEDSVQRLQEQIASGGVAMKPAAAMAPAAAPAVVNAQPEPPQSDYAASPAPQMHAAPESAPAAPAAPVDRKMAASTGSSLYTEGMKLVVAEKSEEGRKALQDFLAADPNSPLVPNALYWIGESYYAQKNYPQAILAFKDVTKRYPKHHKAAAALLKIGMSYALQGEKDNASLYLRALLQDFPKSEPAPAARKKLAELGL